ncbi:MULTISPECIES: endonuclease III domain-containing protein [Actinomyces]|uniref:Base excision DNA repair protein n=1 Tax=Actinomyces respiraculi TaxID=2744574 RepID=A0A7T0LM53_9ACTO|nr:MULTISPECIES: base excision DNA repair protein [Actinomyces]QPL06316.1 base excision DNA repair protein [Actinomyces respiraculi]
MTVSGTRPLPVRRVLERLRRALGEVEPWPGQCDLEYVCGAVLVQNTAWTNVQRALDALREATAFDERRLLALDDDELRTLIRPAGFMRAKSATLRSWASWSLSPAGRGAEHLDDDALRDALLALRGIGPETADVIALMVFHRRRFIFDAYGRRLLAQAGYNVGRGYEPTRRALEERIDAEALSLAELVEIHGLILEAGKRARAAGGWEVYGPSIGVAPGQTEQGRP